MSRKLSVFEFAKALAVLGAIITIYMAVSHFVLTVFWRLVLKLIEKIFSK